MTRMPGRFRWSLGGMTPAMAVAVCLVMMSCSSAGTPGPAVSAQASAVGAAADTTPAPAAAPARRGPDGLTPQQRASIPAKAVINPRVSGGDSTFFVGIDLSPKPPVEPNTPAEEEKLFQLQPGYSLTPILTEPEIQQPAAIAFDADGRMYVLELRSYMLDGDATNELKPISRISRWEDRDNDGTYETGTVFVDSLVFPRFVTPLGDGVILTKESNSDETWKYTDTDGDGRADKRELFTLGLGRSGNVEHQEAFLTWAMDNWMYSTYNTIRVRWTPDGVLREPVGSNGAQWGVTQDNYGKVWFQGGASGVPSYFQFPIEYGNFDVDGELVDGFRTPWGAPIGTADMQGGNAVIRRPENSLKSTTAGAGANVYRGDRLPSELQGDYFYGEVVARILRRVHPEVKEGLTYLHNVYQPEKSEFIKSMDPLFRPVDNVTAPDGTIYIVDMYHGIIQEGEWSQPGSYLRNKIEQYDLEDDINMGRIWRLTYDGMPRDTVRPRMFEESSAQLVTHLTDPNGWWRDMAQQQLVLRQDRSVVPALEKMATTSDNQLARIHALWTLEGLGSLEPSLARSFMADPDPKIRAQGIRASETLYKNGDKSFAADYRKMTADQNTNVAIQAILTLNTLEVPQADATIRTAAANDDAKGVQLVANQILDSGQGRGRGRGFGLAPVQQAMLAQGANTYGSLCSQCHGRTGLGTPVGEGSATIAPPLAGNHLVTGHPDYVIKTILHGLVGPVEGVSYEGGLMPPQSVQTDEWIAAVASYIRTNLTNDASFVTPEQVARVRQATASRTTPYQFDELIASVPVELEPGPTWTVTASNSAPTVIGGTADPARAFNFEGWTTGVPQEAGMWFQIELPQPQSITGLAFDSPVERGRRPAPGEGRPAPIIAYPEAYEVQVSLDGTTWNTVAQGQGSETFTSISFTPVQARFVRITETRTDADGPPWTMRRMRLYALPAQ